jgi:polysaccharide export outer membrane protein
MAPKSIARASLCSLAATAAALVAQTASAQQQPQSQPPAAASPGAPPGASPQTASPTPQAAPAPPVDASYALGPGDSVEIALVGRGDYVSRVRVGTDGAILLPLVGKLQAGGRTVLELADDVRQALIKGGFYSDPVVRADVISISSRYATILGAVGTPGLMPLDRNYHLSEIMARVGVHPGGGADYVVLTHASGESSRYSVTAMATGGGDKDPVVQAGDKIFVPSPESQMFYISGEVKSAGGFPVTEGMTVRMAIARGGGVTENGSEGKITLVRGGKELKRVKLDDPVMPGDVIKIGERLF